VSTAAAIAMMVHVFTVRFRAGMCRDRTFRPDQRFSTTLAKVGFHNPAQLRGVLPVQPKCVSILKEDTAQRIAIG